MRILFLNQYFPPDAAPTGILLRELGDFLTAQGHEAIYVDARQEYRGGKKERGRWIRELRGLFAMAWRALRVRRPDVIFSATSPPCLIVGATLLAKLRGARTAHWLMDMYPELAVALGEIQPGVLSKFLSKMVHACYRHTDVLVALDDDMAALLRSYGARAEVIPPWVLEPLLEPVGGTLPVEVAEPVWLYSGNLGRAHEWRTLLDAQAILEKEGSPARLRFQGRGAARPQAQAYATELGLQRCEWADYAPEATLRHSLRTAAAVVVTQKPEAQGLLWPSKLALLLDLDRPILWVGSPDGAVGKRLQKVAGAGVFAPGDAGGVAEWVRQTVRTQTSAARGDDAASVRQKSILQWEKYLSFRD